MSYRIATHWISAYIVFDPSNRNQGSATEALELFAHYLYATRNVQRLELAIIGGNEASKKVAQKCGFHYDMVWDVVTNKIPELQQAVEHILRQEGIH